jgi:hypothetical protein
MTKWTAGLTDAEVRSAPLGLTPISYHLRHIARSTGRILAYAKGDQLNCIFASLAFADNFPLLRYIHERR